MSRYWNEFPRYEQPDAGELRRKSDASKKKAQSRGKILEPVQVQGRNIAKTWWGKAWVRQSGTVRRLREPSGQRKEICAERLSYRSEDPEGKNPLQECREAVRLHIKSRYGSVRCLRKNVRISFQDAERNWKIWRRCLEGIFRMK